MLTRNKVELATRRNLSRLLSILAFVFFLSAVPARSEGSGYPAPTLTLFQNEQQAQRHCPQDTVVWLNLPSGIYHFKGQRWYANTKNGAFVCEKEADLAGDRATENGQ
jgi:hypothetical protein